jgi:16S rRNA (cytidine1402-2'-O)-methyltransferase
MFTFIGFPPRAAGQRTEAFKALTTGWPAVFYESPHRIAASLNTLAELYPQARVCLCNDLTKKFERIYRGAPAEVLEQLADNPNAEKGEYVCVVSADVQPTAEPEEEISLEAQLVELMVREGITLKEAVGRFPGRKKAAYAASLRLKELF